MEVQLCPLAERYSLLLKKGGISAADIEFCIRKDYTLYKCISIC